MQIPDSPSIIPPPAPTIIVKRTEIKLPTFHSNQAIAYWKFKQSGRRKFLLRCGRRYGKTDFAKIWLGDGFSKGMTCAWYAPEHKTWSEAYSELADHLDPLLGPGSSKGNAVMRGTNGARVDWWTLSNPIAGRGRHYDRVIMDEAAFGKDGDNTVEGSTMFMWEKVIEPTLYDRSGSILVMSNSAGKNAENFLYNISPENDLTGKYGFIEHHATMADNPLLPMRLPKEPYAVWQARRAFELAERKRTRDPLVYDQEDCALFVDWSGRAFFDETKWFMEDGRPLQELKHCDGVYAVVDTAAKTGVEHDGTGVTYFAINNFSKTHPLTVLDWDIQKIEGALLETWLPQVFKNLEWLAQQHGARAGTLGVWIEDKNTGTVLLQQARHKNWNLAQPIDNKLTGMGKSERAINISSYHYTGKVKMLQSAYDKVMTYNGRTMNHQTEQVKSFRVNDPDADKREDDLLDTYCYGVSIGLGDEQGF